jgi:hypothetical protein
LYVPLQYTDIFASIQKKNSTTVFEKEKQRNAKKKPGRSRETKSIKDIFASDSEKAKKQYLKQEAQKRQKKPSNLISRVYTLGRLINND